ncbi:MAG TPA: PilZ domain-containing protein [Thermoanaerobaculia bacterium]|nr:PilZ domain-containing protein [Thermoanaerobaculia bacterium]
MNRRRSERVARRVEVQFWQAGQKIHRGYSTNISATGMHISTANPLPPQSRLRIEVVHGDRGFLIEGVVAHRRAVHPELMKVMPPGMGVRFLSPDELIREIFRPQGVPSAPAAGERGPDADLEPPRQEDLRTFAVRFASAKDFLGIYERDIVNGGLFVATSRPARMREVVSIEIHPPGPTPAPVPLPARVVQRFEPEPGSNAILVGMGVELLDLPSALARLKPIADRLASLL